MNTRLLKNFIVVSVVTCLNFVSTNVFAGGPPGGCTPAADILCGGGTPSSCGGPVFDAGTGGSVDCNTPSPLPMPGCNSCIDGTTDNSQDLTTTTYACGAVDGVVWFVVTVTDANTTFTVTPGTMTDPIVIVDNGVTCDDMAYSTCGSAVGSNPAVATWGTTNGETMLVGVGSTTETNGTFTLCIESAPPPPTPGNTCAVANVICTPDGFSVPMDCATGSGVQPSCFLDPAQQDTWITFTILVDGTLEWTGTPDDNAEYDWALWDISAGGCPGLEVACNYDYSGQCGTPFGMGSTAAEYEPGINVTAGDVYVIQIDNYSQNGVGFNFVWEGTAVITPTASFTVDNDLSCTGNLNVDLTHTGIGSADYDFGNGNTYSGSNPPNQSYTTGVYSITATSTQGACSDVFTQFVTVYDPLAGTIDFTPSPCGSPCTASATVTSITGGDGVYTYEWFDATMTSIGQTGITATNLCDGDYTVTISSAACGSIDLPITVVSPVDVPVNDQTPSLCEDAEGSGQVAGVDLTSLNTAVNPGPGVTYTWYTDAGLTTLVPDDANETVTNGEIFYVEVDNGGCTGVATVTYTINPLPTANDQAPVLCEDAAGSGQVAGVDLTGSNTAINGAGGITYTWYTDAGLTTAVTDELNETVTNGEVFYVEVDNGTCTNVAVVTYTINTLPVIAAVVTDPTVCNGTDGSIEVTLVSGPTSSGTLDWTGTISGSNIAADITADSPDIITLGAGSYDITFTDANGCVSNIETVGLANPGAPIIDPMSAVVSCLDYTIDLSMVTGTNLMNPQFYSETGGPAGTGVMIPDLTTFSAFTDTTIYVYDENGTCSAEVQFNVTINTTPTLTVQDTTTCAPNTIDLTDVTYWSTDVGTISYFESDGTTPVADATLAGAGNYVLEADNLGCVSTANVTVTVNATPTLTVQDTTTCSPNTIDLTDVTYWSADVGTISYFESDGTTPVADATLAGAGIYVLEADNLGCVSTANATVTVNTTPTLTVQDTTTCAPNTIDLTDVTYWSADVGTISYFESDGTTPVADATLVGAGNYVLEADNLGCVSTANVTVTVNTTPTLTVQDTTTCSPNTIDLTDVTYWSSDVGTISYFESDGTTPVADATLAGAGIYVLEADNLGCVSTANVTVTVNTTPTLTVQDTTTCSPNTIDLTDVTYWSTDVGTISYFESDGTTPVADATIAGAGNYVLEADNLGCVSTANVTVTITAVPILTVQDTTDCSPFTVDLTDVTYWSADVGTLSYFESDGITPIANASAVGAGSYVIEADNLGCVSTANVLVTEVTTPVVDPLGPISECDSYTLPVITGTSLSGTEAYYTGMGGTGTQFNSGDAVTTSGLTTLYIYDGASGCSDEEQLDITITVTPTITAVDPAAVCEPNTVDISGAASADVGTLTWYTDAGLTTPVVDPTQVSTGSYYAEADNNGCTSSDMITVTVNPLPPAPTAGTDSTYCSVWTLENITATGGAGTMTWYDSQNNILGTGSSYTPSMNIGVTDYYVTETLNGCEGPSSVVIITIEDCDITIPTAITPNSDLNNDDWEILSLDAVYPDNTVRVFNRWGNLIFEHISTPSSPYDQNRWDGTYEGSTLPVGSYYYVIELNNDEEPFTGSVSIILD